MLWPVLAAYAARDYAPAVSPGPKLTAEQVGQAVLDTATDPAPDQTAYLPTPAGLRPLP